VTYRLDGLVEAGDAVRVDVPDGTEFVSAIGESESRVTAGQTLGALRLISTEPASGTVAESRSQLAASRVGDVIAPVSGVATFGPDAVAIKSAGLDVVVPLKPLQELRYRALRFSGTATVETVLGQRKSPCVAIWLQEMPGAAESEQEASSAVHCRLAANVETAAGLPAVLTLASTPEEGAIAVPLIYIGLDTTGTNYLARVREGPTTVDRPVVVGATDGVRRVITSGLEPGELLDPVGTP
jgi:hypothetical protein